MGRASCLVRRRQADVPAGLLPRGADNDAPIGPRRQVRITGRQDDVSQLDIAGIQGKNLAAVGPDRDCRAAEAGMMEQRTMELWRGARRPVLSASIREDTINMSAAHTRPAASLAPWAEIVPDAPWPMTVDDLMDWPDDDEYIYELVEGTLVRVEGSGYLASAIGVTIGAALKASVRPVRLGRVTACAVYRHGGDADSCRHANAHAGGDST